MIDVGQVIVMGAAAAVGGTALVRIVRSSALSRRARLVAALMAVAVTIGVAGAANALRVHDWVNVTLGLRSQLDVESERLGERLLREPQFRKLIEGRSSAEAQEITANLSKTGIQYLSEAQLTRWVTLQRQMADHSAAFCAARWKGGMDPRLFTEAVAALNDDERAEWLQMSTTATLTALHGGRPPSVPYDAMLRGLKEIFGNLPNEQRDQALADAARRGISDDRACELLKMILSGAERLPPDLRVNFLRALTQL